MQPQLSRNGTKKSRRRRRLEVDNREASNKEDRSHSMSMKIDDQSNDPEGLTTLKELPSNAGFFVSAPNTGTVQAYRLKNWSAAEREARLPAMSASSREISSCINCTRAASSSTESRLRSCPISWVIFFFGLSSSSIAAMRASKTCHSGAQAKRANLESRNKLSDCIWIPGPAL